MAGLHVTYDHLIASSRMDRLDVNARFPGASPKGPLLPIALRQRIARIAGVSVVGSYYWLWGYYQNPHNRARIIAVDSPMRAAWAAVAPDVTAVGPAPHDTDRRLRQPSARGEARPEGG